MNKIVAGPVKKKKTLNFYPLIIFSTGGMHISFNASTPKHIHALHVTNLNIKAKQSQTANGSKERHKRNDDLALQHNHCSESQQPVRKLMDVPG